MPARKDVNDKRNSLILDNEAGLKHANPEKNESYDHSLKKDKQRQGLLYNAANPAWNMWLSYSGTMFQEVLFKPAFWVNIFVFAITCVFAPSALAPRGTNGLVLSEDDINGRFGISADNGVTVFMVNYLRVDWSLVGTLGSSMMFFLFFFSNKNYARFIEQYDCSMTAQGMIHDISILCRVFMYEKDPEGCKQIVRYCNAAHAVAYVGLSESYDDGWFHGFNKENHVLTDAEFKNLTDPESGGRAKRELLTMVLHIAKRARDRGFIDAYDFPKLIETIIQLRRSLGCLYDYSAQPLPFFYIHLVYFLTTFYLPLYSYAVGFTYGAEYFFFSFLVVLFNELFVLGLLAVGAAMTDPYGHDLADLCVPDYVIGSYLQSNINLNVMSLDEFAGTKKATKQSPSPTKKPASRQDSTKKAEKAAATTTKKAEKAESETYTPETESPETDSDSEQSSTPESEEVDLELDDN